jgi:hypothetical protein
MGHPRMHKLKGQQLEATVSEPLVTSRQGSWGKARKAHHKPVLVVTHHRRCARPVSPICAHNPPTIISLSTKAPAVRKCQVVPMPHLRSFWILAKDESTHQETQSGVDANSPQTDRCCCCCCCCCCGFDCGAEASVCLLCTLSFFGEAGAGPDGSVCFLGWAKACKREMGAREWARCNEK